MFYGYVLQDPVNWVDMNALARTETSLKGWVIGATGGALVGIGFTTGKPVIASVRLCMVAVGGAIQMYDYATTVTEQVDKLKESKDVKEIEKNINNIQDLINKNF